MELVSQSKGKIRLMLLRDFYPLMEEDFISSMEERGYDFRLAKHIANELSFDLQRALSIYFEKFGLNVIDIFVSSERIQRIWEKIFAKDTDTFISKILRDVRPVSKIGFFSTKDFYIIFAKQVAYYKPDVILVLPFAEVNHYFFSKLKRIFGFKLVGYSNATPFGYTNYISSYDFVFSPFMPHVFKLRSFGVKVEYIPLAFEPVILEKIKEKADDNEKSEKMYDIVFIGSLHQAHRSRIPFLRKIAEVFKERFHIWTQSELSLPPELKANFKGEAFLFNYYHVVKKSKIVLNHHGSILPWAHNLRLFETTGLGSFLLTDILPGMEELFEPEKEIETYSNLDECIDKIKYYLLDDGKREEIAKAGQMRTLSEHTYEKRIEKLFDSFLKYNIL